MNPFVQMPNGERFLRIKEVAECLRMSDKTVRRMIDARQLASVKIRGLRLVCWSDLQKMLQPSTQ
jgi:excisionase family DNA binding protein